MDVVLAAGHAAMLVSMAAQMTEPNEIPVAMASGAMVEPFSDSVASVTEPATTFTKKRKNQEVPFSGYTTARKTAVNMVYAWWLITQRKFNASKSAVDPSRTRTGRAFLL